MSSGQASRPSASAMRARLPSNLNPASVPPCATCQHPAAPTRQPPPLKTPLPRRTQLPLSAPAFGKAPRSFFPRSHVLSLEDFTDCPGTVPKQSTSLDESCSPLRCRRWLAGLQSGGPPGRLSAPSLKIPELAAPLLHQLPQVCNLISSHHGTCEVTGDCSG